MISTKPLDKYHLMMLQLILADPKIRKTFIMDGQIVGEFTILPDGSVKLGKSKCGWINTLFNQYVTITFFEVANRIACNITGADTNHCDKDSMVGFIRETIDKVINTDEKDKVVELLLYYTMLFDENSALKLKYNMQEDNPQPERKSGAQIKTGIIRALMDIGGETLPVELNVECY